jgi:holo-ACP synthase CitX
MSYARLKTELLVARDAREALLASARAGAATTLISVSTAIPGPVKTPPGSEQLFEWGLQQLQQRLRLSRVLAGRVDLLGPFSVISVDMPPQQVKQICVAIEQQQPAARLLDLDVYAADGRRLGSSDAGAPARRCLLCAQPATDCIRLQRHPLEELLAHVKSLLTPFV